MRHIVLGLSVVLAACLAAGCPKPADTGVGKTSPDELQARVIDTFPTGDQPAGPGHSVSQGPGDGQLSTSCEEGVRIASTVYSLAPGLLRTSFHLVVILDLAAEPRNGEKDIALMQKMYDCLVDGFLASGDRLSVLPFAYNKGLESPFAAWYIELPLEPYRRTIADSFFQQGTIPGTWDWTAASAMAIKSIEDGGITDVPTVIIAFSNLSGGALRADESTPVPSEIQKKIDQFAPPGVSVTSIRFPYDRSAMSAGLPPRSIGTSLPASAGFLFNRTAAGDQSSGATEMSAHILVNKTASGLILPQVDPQAIELIIENQGPIHVGEAVTLKARLPERLGHLADTGQARFYWFSDGTVEGVADSASDTVTWTYTQAGVYKPRVGMTWTEAASPNLFQGETDLIVQKTSESEEGGQ